MTVLWFFAVLSTLLHDLAWWFGYPWLGLGLNAVSAVLFGVLVWIHFRGRG